MPKHIFNPAAVSASGGKSLAFKSAVVLSCFFLAYGTVILFVEPFLGDFMVAQYLNSTKSDDSERRPSVPNVLFPEDWKYRGHRWPQLLLLTRQEAEFGRRMLFSLVVGALLGLERRESNRGAGVRTMSLVSLGACIFTIGSIYAFEAGTQTWDSSRVAAALPSGVGFLGGALIFKDSGQIKGLTTACGVWLACAVGMCCGGGMYFVAFFGVAVCVATLRFGPRSPMPEDEEEDKAHETLEEPLIPVLPKKKSGLKDLRVWSPLHKDGQKKVVGCYSPCGKLTYSNWDNPVGKNAPNSPGAEMYCCPTPPVSPEGCRKGPVEQTQYVKLIHESCPNVYGYAYDDAVGLQVCPSGTTYIWSIGCPNEPAPGELWT